MSKKQIITITNQAYNRLHNILKSTNKNNIKFFLKGGGCNGFNYYLEPSNDKPEKYDEIVKLKNFEVHVCGNSLIHLLGTNIDWKEDVMESKFYFDNPMANSKCGCGTSFSSKALNK